MILECFGGDLEMILACFGNVWGMIFGYFGDDLGMIFKSFWRSKTLNIAKFGPKTIKNKSSKFSKIS